MGITVSSLRRMRIAHLVASPFLGGPERQILGHMNALSEDCDFVVLGFDESGKSHPFLSRARDDGHEVVLLEQNTPSYRASIAEITNHLKRCEADILVCHGYKPDILGFFAARRARIPFVAVSRGWTGATAKVRVNECADRCILRLADCVVCVSEAQARKVWRSGVSSRRIRVIHNAIDSSRFSRADAQARRELNQLFESTPTHIVGAAGRLSPEKGFDIFVDAAARVVHQYDSAHFVLFGDGELGAALEERVTSWRIGDRFTRVGFRDDLDRLIPHLDLFVIPSYTEGLSNVALEASAAGIPIVATAVGGNPEVVIDHKNGRLVPSGNPARMASAIVSLLHDEHTRKAMGEHARAHVEAFFTFQAQGEAYLDLFRELYRGAKRHKTKIR